MNRSREFEAEELPRHKIRDAYLGWNFKKTDT
jgi:hypothetical protein